MFIFYHLVVKTVSAIEINSYIASEKKAVLCFQGSGNKHQNNELIDKNHHFRYIHF